MNENTVTLNKKGHDRHYLLRVLCYSLYAGANGIESLVIGYLTYYMTNSLFFAATAAGVLVALAKIFDGVSDVLAGIIIDKSHLKSGKGRPFTLFGVLMWVGIIALFSTPAKLPLAAKYAYVFIMYILTDTVFRTLYATADPVHYRRGFAPAERMDSPAIWGPVGGLLVIVASIIMPTLLAVFGSLDNCWTIIMVILAVPCALMFLLKFFFIPEKYDLDEESVTEKTEKIKLLDAIKMLIQNKYLLMVGLVLLLVTVIMSMSSVQTYYFTYIIGDISKLSLANTFSMAQLVVMIFFPALAKKMGKRNMAMIFFFIGAVVSLFALFCPTNVIALGIIYTVRVCCYSAFNCAPIWYTIDCMKYMQWKNGVRNDALCGAVTSLAQKLGAALTMLITGLVLDIFGFDGAQAVQSQSALGAISFMYIIFPAIVMALCGVIMYFYKLDKMMPQIDKELEER